MFPYSGSDIALTHVFVGLCRVRQWYTASNLEFDWFYWIVVEYVRNQLCYKYETQVMILQNVRKWL